MASCPPEVRRIPTLAPPCGPLGTPDALSLLDSAMPPKVLVLEPGAHVLARFMRRTRWYPGVVRQINEDGTAWIDYDDGDVEMAVERQHIKLPKKAPAPSATVSATPSLAPQPTPLREAGVAVTASSTAVCTAEASATGTLAATVHAPDAPAARAEAAPLTPPPLPRSGVDEAASTTSVRAPAAVAIGVRRRLGAKKYTSARAAKELAKLNTDAQFSSVVEGSPSLLSAAAEEPVLATTDALAEGCAALPRLVLLATPNRSKRQRQQRDLYEESEDYTPRLGARLEFAPVDVSARLAGSRSCRAKRTRTACMAQPCQRGSHVAHTVLTGCHLSLPPGRVACHRHESLRLAGVHPLDVGPALSD